MKSVRTNEQYMCDQIQPLVGSKIIGAATTSDGESFGIVIKKGKTETVLWVACDPEGNGSGWLDIEVQS